MLARVAISALLVTLAAGGKIIFPDRSEYTSQAPGISQTTPRQVVLSSRNGQVSFLVFSSPSSKFTGSTSTSAPSTTAVDAETSLCPAEAPEGTTEDTLDPKCFKIQDDDFISVYSALDQPCSGGLVRMHDARCVRAVPIPQLRSSPPKKKSKPKNKWVWPD